MTTTSSFQSMTASPLSRQCVPVYWNAAHAGNSSVRSGFRECLDGRGASRGMTTVGFIGSGRIGSTVARLAVDAGQDGVLSNSRGPETLSDLVNQLGPHARAATSNEAAAAGDIVVVTIPLNAYRTVPIEPLRGKVVIDTLNYCPQRDDHIAELDDGSTTSSELLQAHLPESRVVKAFNNINFRHLGSLQRPAGHPERSVLAIAGDDETAKKTVAGFLDS